MGRYTPEILSDENYIRIVRTLMDGYIYNGKISRPNRRIATILQLLFNTGANISELVTMKKEDLIYENEVWLFKAPLDGNNRQKFYVLAPKVKRFIDDYIEYIDDGKIFKLQPNESIFGRISEQAIWKMVRNVCKYLNLQNVSPGSFKKRSIERVFIKSECNEEVLFEYLQQHSSVTYEIMTAIDGKDRSQYRMLQRN